MFSKMKKMRKSFLVKTIILAVALTLSVSSQAEARRIISQSGYMLDNGCAMITTTYGYYLFGILLWTSEGAPDIAC